MPLSTQLIGVDGGATRVRALEVEVDSAPGAVRLRAGARTASAAHRAVPGFETPAEQGLYDEPELGRVTPAEREQAWAWIESTARCVLEVARARGAVSVLVGVAMPGRKTEDGRGIAFALNGPRVPDFLDRLGEQLVADGLELAAPLAGLYGDGWCAGLGERGAEGGGLGAPLRTAYYIGGGTGLAEALVLGGEQLPLERVEDWFPRAWRMRWNQAPLEDWLAVGGLNRRWAELSGFELPLEHGRFPEDQLRRDPRARELLEQTGEALGHLIAHRAVALATGVPPELGVLGAQSLERVVIGQQLGRLFGDPRTHSALRASFERMFDEQLRRTGLDALYPPDGGGGSARRELVRVSRLPHAAALGAAIGALNEWSGAHG